MTTQQAVPLSTKGRRASTTGQLSPRCVTRTLSLVAGAAAVLTLYGGLCLINNDVCPPPLPTVNGTNNTHNMDRSGISDTAVGLLMVILGVVANLPVALVWCIRRGRFDTCVVAGPGPAKVDPLEEGGTGKSSGSRRLLMKEEVSLDNHAPQNSSSPLPSSPSSSSSSPSLSSSPSPSPQGGVENIRLVNKHQAVGMLFAAHFLSAWGDRMWQFAVPVLFIEIFLDTLAPTALYAFLVYAACVQCMPSVGSWVDREHRLSVQRFALIVDNASVVGTSVLLCYVAVTETGIGVVPPDWNGSFTLCFVGIIILGISGEVMNQAQTLSVERDWVVVIAKEMGSLATMNTMMRRIDLMCKVLAPAAVGAIISTVGSSSRMKVFYGSAAVGVWNALAFPLELLLTTVVFHAFPALDAKRHSHMDGVTKHSHPGGHIEHSHFVHQHAIPQSSSSDSEGKGDGGIQKTNPHWHDTFGPVDHVHHKEAHAHARGHGHSHGHGHGHSHGPPQQHHIESKDHGNEQTTEGASAVVWGPVVMETSHFTGGTVIGEGGGKSSPCAALVRGFRSYVRHPVLLASVSLSLLYCTVLDNGALMTAYLTWRGVDPAVVGASRGAGAIFGLIGTFVYPQLLKCNGGSVERAGLYSVWLFWICLVPGLVMFYIAGESNVSDYTVLSVMVVSRVGLWAFDLAVTQIMQEYISEEDRGIVNSTQTATMQVFSCVILVGGLIFSEPKQFIVLVTFSIFVVLAACLTYTRWYRNIKAHNLRRHKNQDEESGSSDVGYVQANFVLRDDDDD
jgi:hypothetical protein